MESKYTKHNPSGAPGGESSADYIISESGEEQRLSTQSRKGKKSGLESVTDTLKEKVTGTAKSIKEGVSSTVGINDDADDRTKDLESAHVHQDRIGEASSDPKTTGPTDKVREKAAETTDESQDSEEPA
jgi:hypothetical protein